MSASNQRYQGQLPARNRVTRASKIVLTIIALLLISILAIFLFEYVPGAVPFAYANLPMEQTIQYQLHN